MTADRLVARLAEFVGADHVLTDPALTASYTTDWTRRFQGEAAAVVRPADTPEVAAVVAACAEAQVPIVTQGGNTGLVGAGVPRRRPMVVLTTTRLVGAGPVDTAAGQITLGAGVTIAEWRRLARAAGLDAPIDFAARDTATVGGATATNAGGSRVVRFGTMRAQVMGLRAVLGSGAVVGSLSGLPKETIGLHWPALLAGSEGTLGVVTEVRLRLVPWYRRRAAAMVAVELGAAVRLLDAARRSLPHLDGAELMLDGAMAVAADHLGRGAPVVASSPSAAFVVIECADHVDPTDDLVEFLAGADGVVDSAVAVATDDTAIARLVEPRDRMSEAIARLGVPLKFDVAVAPGRLTELVAAVESAVAAAGCRFVGFGHLAEGNVHVNVLGPRRGDGTHDSVDESTAAHLADEILGIATDLGGTISAEHGVGVAKARWLPLVRSPDELAVLDAIRGAVDPQRIMNPGVLTAESA